MKPASAAEVGSVRLRARSCGTARDGPQLARREVGINSAGTAPQPGSSLAARRRWSRSGPRPPVDDDLAGVGAAVLRRAVGRTAGGRQCRRARASAPMASALPSRVRGHRGRPSPLTREPAIQRRRRPGQRTEPQNSNPMRDGRPPPRAGSVSAIDCTASDRPVAHANHDLADLSRDKQFQLPALWASRHRRRP